MLLFVEVGKLFAVQLGLLWIALPGVMLCRPEHRVTSAGAFLGAGGECKWGWTWGCASLREKLQQQLIAWHKRVTKAPGRC